MSVTRKAIEAVRRRLLPEGITRRVQPVERPDFEAVCNVIDALHEEVEKLKKEIRG